MPRKEYNQRLTDEELIGLVASGKYSVDIDLGEVRGRNGQLLFTYCGSNRSTTPYVRLYDQPKYRTLPVSRLVWIIATQSPIPQGFDIHHEDLDDKNNQFENLFALHTLDHSKKHNNKKPVDSSAPF